MSLTDLKQLVLLHEAPKRKTLSARFPILQTPVIFVRTILTHIENVVRFKIARKKAKTFYPCVVGRHQSVLRRKLGDSDPRLQEQKVINLKRACEDLNGLVVYPGEVFSLWSVLGKPTKKRGYVDGMLLSNGRVVEGVGGGLCQLSNFLCWIFLHADTEVVERYHHSMDVFPDSGRTLPFGSGATCLHNFVDLKIRNVGNIPLQLKVWVSDKHLKGQLVSIRHTQEKFSVRELNHRFVKRDDVYFRYNEIWRVRKVQGEETGREKVFVNFAPVLYPVSTEYLEDRGYMLTDLSGV